MKKLFSMVLVSWLFLIFAVFLSNSFAKEQTADVKVLKIGLITSMTGPMAPAFKSLVDAARPAADLMNQKGGVSVNGLKYRIEIITEDDQSSPPGAIAAANKLIQAGVQFMIPPMFMVSNMAIAPTTEAAKVLRMKAMGNGREEVGPGLRYSFYASTSIYNIPVVYSYLKKNYPKVKRIAIITPDDPGGKTGRELTEKEIRKQGMQIVFQEAFKIGTEDFYPILTKALKTKPDAIDVIVSIVPWSAGIINQSRELGFTGPIYAPQLFGDINILNSILNPKYAYDVFHGGPDVLSPKMTPIMKEFRALVEQQVKTPLNIDHAIVIESLYDILQGIQKAQSLDPDKVASALENMKSIDTVFGPGRMAGKDVFGINHAIRRPIPISRIEKGKVEFEFSGKD